jgi:sacsin
MDVAESFGQKVDLTARLREILQNYPEGTTILRELLQNAVRAAHAFGLARLCRAARRVQPLTPRARAGITSQDDAGARTVRLCLDTRTHGKGTLAFAEAAAFQGPALLAFNDAVFTEADFQSISRIGDSVKREQEGKTGRFGCAALRSQGQLRSAACRCVRALAFASLWRPRARATLSLT